MGRVGSIRGWGFVAAAVLSGCSGGGGGDSRKSEVTVDVDGVPSDSTGQTSGVDAAGDSFLVITGPDWSIEIRFPGDDVGDFSSTSTSGAQVLYTDAAGNTYLASDATAGSSYSVSVTSYSGSSLDGTFTATVVGPAAATHTISGTFALAFSGVSSSDPYKGTYIGLFRARGEALQGYEEGTGNPIWGPTQTASLQVTLKLVLLAAVDGSAVYNIEHANVSDPFFGCNVGGCTPTLGSAAVLPEDPGTPTPNGPSEAGHGFVVTFPNGSTIVTENQVGSLYTSTDARTLSNALGIVESWYGTGGANEDFLVGTFGASYYLNPDTQSITWALTKSAL